MIKILNTSQDFDFPFFVTGKDFKNSVELVTYMAKIERKGVKNLCCLQDFICKFFTVFGRFGV